MVCAVKGHILHQHAKFHKDRSDRCGDIAIFVIFQDGGRRHFGFSKIWNFNGCSAVRGQYASLYQILSKSVKRLQRYSDLTVFFIMAAVRHLGFVGRRLGPPTTSSWWSDNMKLSIFCPFGLKTPIHAPKIGFLGVFHPKNGEQYHKTPKRHILARVRVVWAIKRENPSTGLTCRWVDEKKGINK